MSMEFRDELQLGNRMIILAMAPFSAFVGFVLTSYFEVFSREASELVISIFLGDFTRFGDFVGFLLLCLCSVVIPIILVLASFYTALVSPNHVTHIDADRRMVTCDFDLPWMTPYRRSYRFDELRIKLIYDDECNTLKLRVPDRWFGLTLISESSSRVAERKFTQLVENGLSNR